MIKEGRILFIGDEFLEVIALAAGFDAFVFRNDCKELKKWIDDNINTYDAVIYLDNVYNQCRDVIEYFTSTWREKVYLMIENPLTTIHRDPKEYYRELARKILGVEIVLE